MAVQDRLGSFGKKGKKVLKGGDARNRLIQKNRANIQDARQRLGQITKLKGDARNILKSKPKAAGSPKKGAQFGSFSRLNDVKVDYKTLTKKLSPALQKKLLQNAGIRTNQVGQKNRPIGSGIKKRPERPVIKAKTAIQNGALVRTVNGSDRPRPKQNARGPVRKVPVAVKRVGASPRSIPKPKLRQEMMKPRQERRPARTPIWEEPRRMEYAAPRVAKSRPTYVEVQPQPAYVTIDEWDSRTPVYASPRSTYVEEVKYIQPRKTYLSENMIDRLAEERKPAPSQGYKISVSNLHESVSLEDVEELFGNVGPLSSVKMLQEGSAEIVFINKEDAYRSIEEYHYRLLDGQPMHVSIVNEALNRRKTVTSGGFQPASKRYVQAEAPSRPVVKSVLRAAGGSMKYITTDTRRERVRPYSPPTPKPQYHRFSYAKF